jgi:FtsP/CotA-like multicopper oxidase with cupredoxin domain
MNASPNWQRHDTGPAHLGNQSRQRRLTRRQFLEIGGVAAAGAAAFPLLGSTIESLVGGAPATAAGGPIQKNLHLAATDGFVYAPGSVANPYGPVPFLPDPLADAPRTMWGFGFRDVTNLSASQVLDQKGKFQSSAPIIFADQEDELRITLTNLGLSVRPDLTDAHTIHFHGFRDAIPLFDGVPEMSVAVPIGRQFTYFYKPHNPGTYMYHCHNEDTEHVSMGMRGCVFVRPTQDQNPPAGGVPNVRFAYNDAVAADPADPQSTYYDREFVMFLEDAWAQEHFEGAHIQEHDWSEYRADLWFLNGRSYPDTLLPNGGGADATGDLIPPTDGVTTFPHLKYNPISSLIQAKGGDRVLLRFANLGFQQHAMTLDGIPMRVVGKDATLLRGRDGTDIGYLSNTVYIGPGESVDAIFRVPSVPDGTKYRLFNRNYAYLHNPGLPGPGGQMTEVQVVSALGAQTVPNTNPAP